MLRLMIKAVLLHAKVETNLISYIIYCLQWLENLSFKKKHKHIKKTGLFPLTSQLSCFMISHCSLTEVLVLEINVEMTTKSYYKVNSYQKD